jgi:hypothetical protein
MGLYANPMRVSCAESTASSRWSCRPLCVRYAFVEFQTLRLPTHHMRSVRQDAWLWALALFDWSGYEVLGAWSKEVPHPSVGEDLRQRGVKQVKVIRGEAGIECALEFSRAKPFSDAGAFSPLRRMAIQAASNIARGLQSSFVRAIDGRAPFASECFAEDFLFRQLERADRKLEHTPESPVQFVGPRLFALPDSVRGA